MAPQTHLEQGGLTAWSRAQQSALYHRQLAEQHIKDEAKDEKDERELKAKKREEKEVVKPDQITAASIIAKILQGWCPALYEFLDIFGEPHSVLPIFLAFHVLYWFTAPWYLSSLLPIPMTHLLPMVLSFKSLFLPTGALEAEYTECKKNWQQSCEVLKKEGKDKVDFPDPPSPPPSWKVCVRDRRGWLAYWVWVGIIGFLETVCFGDQVMGLIWWPKMKAICFVSLYLVWEAEDNGHQTVGALKLIDPFLPESLVEDKADKKKGK